MKPPGIGRWALALISIGCAPDPSRVVVEVPAEALDGGASGILAVQHSSGLLAWTFASDDFPTTLLENNPVDGVVELDLLVLEAPLESYRLSEGAIGLPVSDGMAIPQSARAHRLQVTGTELSPWTTTDPNSTVLAGEKLPTLDSDCGSTQRDGGDGRCVDLVVCSPGYSDGGDSRCYPRGICVRGTFDPRSARCVVKQPCPDGYWHSGGGDVCTIAGRCGPGFVTDFASCSYRACPAGLELTEEGCRCPEGQEGDWTESGTLRCYAECSDGLHDDGEGRCVPGGTCAPGFRLDSRVCSSRFVPEAYLKTSNAGVGDGFGSRWAADLSNDTLVIPASSESSCARGVNGDGSDDNCPSAGAVYVFRRSREGLWAEEAYIKASNSGARDRFGYSLALSASTLAVSALDEDSCAKGIGGDEASNGCTDSGAVYVFGQNSEGIWSQQAYIKASNSYSVDGFGSSLVLEGDILGVSALYEDSCASGINGDPMNDDCSEAGAFYVFHRETTGAWRQEAYLKPADTDPVDRFGWAAALSGDTLAVSTFRDDSCATDVNGDATSADCTDSGAVEVFRRSSDGAWRQEAFLKASDPDPGDNFGSSLTLSEDILAVGVMFEDSCATGVNGRFDDNGCGSAGAAYVFGRNREGTWAKEAYLKASSSDPNDNFGSSVVFAAGILAVGARGDDSCAMGIDGDYTDNGCTDTGAVHVFRRTPGP